MIELHTSQLQCQKLKQQPNSVGSLLNTPNGDASTQTADLIQKKLEEELEKRFGKENDTMRIALFENEVTELKKENTRLRDEIVQLSSETYGAKLAAKYLEKELAGRVQQIQLFGKNLKQEEHERLWNQLEAEIHLHRHKTVIKACRGKRLRHKSKVDHASPSSVATSSATSDSNSDVAAAASASSETLLDELLKSKRLNQLRTVKLKRNDPKEGLGISITGGSEHGVPILISEIHDNGPAARSGQLLIGDAIVSANGTELKDLMHAEAVCVLTNLVGDVELKVYFVQVEDDSEIENNSLHDLSYPFFDEHELVKKKADNRSLNSNLSVLTDRTETLNLANANTVQNQNQAALSNDAHSFTSNTK